MTGYFLCFYLNIYEMKPDIFEIFRTFSRYLEKKFDIFRKKRGISGNILRRFFVIFVSRPIHLMYSRKVQRAHHA